MFVFKIGRFSLEETGNVNMTKEEQNIQIAQACGWKHAGHSLCGLGGYPPIGTKIFGPEEEGDWRIRWGKEEGERYYPLPDYFEDLNSCYEMEKNLTFDEWQDYVDYLIENSKDTNEPHRGYQVCHATAEERANAFLLILILRKIS